MKVIAINGSARKDGNTTDLIKMVFEELNKEKNLQKGFIILLNPVGIHSRGGLRESAVPVSFLLITLKQSLHDFLRMRFILL